MNSVDWHEITKAKRVVRASDASLCGNAIAEFRDNIVILKHGANFHKYKMVCKGRCVRHKALKPRNPVIGRYSIGQKRCQICETFLKWDGLWYPCCGYRLRTRPRNLKLKSELRTRKEIEKGKLSAISEQSAIQALR